MGIDYTQGDRRVCVSSLACVRKSNIIRECWQTRFPFPCFGLRYMQLLAEPPNAAKQCWEHFPSIGRFGQTSSTSVPRFLVYLLLVTPRLFSTLGTGQESALEKHGQHSKTPSQTPHIILTGARLLEVRRSLDKACTACTVREKKKKKNCNCVPTSREVCGHHGGANRTLCRKNCKRHHKCQKLALGDPKARPICTFFNPKQYRRRQEDK